MQDHAPAPACGAAVALPLVPDRELYSSFLERGFHMLVAMKTESVVQYARGHVVSSSRVGLVTSDWNSMSTLFQLSKTKKYASAG